MEILLAFADMFLLIILTIILFNEWKMAKMTIEFDTVEDNDEMSMCINGSKWYSVAWELDQYFRSRMKYEPMNDKEYNVIEESRAKLRELIRESGLTFD